MISIKKQSVDGLESWQTDLHGLTAHTKLERLGSGSRFYIPPLTFSINRIKEKVLQGSILKIKGFYRSGLYFDFENGAFNYILLQDDKSGREFYLFAILIDDKVHNRYWIKPYHGDKTE